MKTKLKQFRVDAGMTQAKLATAVGVTQPNYHRWESGAAPIPEAKLNKLARVLKTSPEAILGRHPPVEARLYDDSVSDDLSYYGEVAIPCCCRSLKTYSLISIETYREMPHSSV